MKSVEKYARVIVENSDLNFEKKTPRYSEDEKNKIGLAYIPQKWVKHVRFTKINGKDNMPFLYLQEDIIRKIFRLTLVVRENDKTDVVRIDSYGGHDIAIYKDYEQELLLFIHDTKFIIRDKSYLDTEISPSEFNVNDIVNEICNTIITMYDSEKWNEEIDGMLEFIRPAITMIIEDSKDLWKRRINTKLNELEESIDVIQYKELKEISETLNNDLIQSTYSVKK